MKRYYDLTKEEKLNLSGYAIINQHGFKGFTVPPDSVVFYELVAKTRYGGTSSTGIAYKTEEAAKRGLEGAIFLEEEGYGITKKVVPSGYDLTYSARFVGLVTHKPFGSSFEEYAQDDTEFDALTEEIRKELNQIWQDDYNTKVTADRRKEYMRLAGDNEEIAKAFWDKAEKTPWPAE
jgi:hypothetical protein